MSETSWIDLARAAETARAWVDRGHEVAAQQYDLETDLRRLELDERAARVATSLGRASAGLWAEANFAMLLADRTVAADLGHGFAAVRAGSAIVAELRAEAGALAPPPPTTCVAPWIGHVSPLAGDLGGTFWRELRAPYFTVGATPEARGRSLVARALGDAASARHIRADEFGLVELGDDRFLVVLPGVVDLSAPAIGLDDGHRSVRDLDRHAIASSRSTLVADNGYARMVADGLAAARVPVGADLVIVGHSFGADAALDLAADAGFNGPRGYRVSHVVAAGYYSDPQLPSVDPRTEVLVLQNHRDLAVLVEAGAHGDLTEAAVDGAGFVSSWSRGDVVGVATHGVGALWHGAGAVAHGAGYAWDHRDDVADVAVGVALSDPARVARGAGELLTRRPRVERVGPNQVLDVFEGGGSGGGHHLDHYVDEVYAVDDALVTEFFASLDLAGYTGHGTAWAIDVSVP